MRVRLTSAAQRDLTAQLAWLKEKSPKAGRRAAEAIVRSLDLLGTFPDLGPSVRFEVREQDVRFSTFGFVIEYERHPQMIVVRRISHGAQLRGTLP